jgi:hypothetical protein
MVIMMVAMMVDRKVDTLGKKKAVSMADWMEDRSVVKMVLLLANSMAAQRD